MIKQYHPQAPLLRNDIARVKIDEDLAYSDPEYTKVHNALSDCYIDNMHKQRYRIYYGSRSDGRVWLEDHDVVGYVSVSSGPTYQRGFILVANARSYGGSLISPGLVLGIQNVKTKQFTYKHPLFHFPQLEVDGVNLYMYTEPENALPRRSLWATCGTPEKAEHLKQFYLGQRMTKA